MKFKNKSNWDTNDLLKLTKAILNWSGQKQPSEVEVITSRRWYSGRASLGYPKPSQNWMSNRWVLMRVVNPWRQGYAGDDGRTVYRDVPFDNETYAQILIHEVGHNEGLRHKEMRDHTSIEIPKDILGIKVSPKVIKERPKRDLIAERKAHAIAMLKKNETKLKRLQGVVKRWKRKVKYYEGNICV